jgi:hypothetical protein
VSLRVEEDLRVHHVVAAGPLQIRPRQVVEVLFLLQDSGARVVDLQKRLQVGKLVRRQGFLDGGVRQGHPVALAEREHQVGLERALDVYVELRLRELAYEIARHRTARSDRSETKGGDARWTPPP